MRSNQSQFLKQCSFRTCARSVVVHVRFQTVFIQSWPSAPVHDMCCRYWSASATASSSCMPQDDVSVGTCQQRSVYGGGRICCLWRGTWCKVGLTSLIWSSRCPKAPCLQWCNAFCPAPSLLPLPTNCLCGFSSPAARQHSDDLQPTSLVAALFI